MKRFMRKVSIWGLLGLMLMGLTGCTSFLEEVGEEILAELDSYDADWEAYNQEGLDLMDQGEQEKALIAFNKAIEMGMEKDAAYNNISWAYNELGEYEKALKYILLAQELEKGDSIQYVNYGNSLYGLGRYDEAIEQFNNAITYDNILNDAEGFARYGLTQCYIDLQEYEKALEEIEIYLELEPDDLDSHTDKAYCLLYLGEFTKAYTYADNLTTEYPDSLMVASTKADIMVYVESPDNVLAYHKELIERFKDNVDVWFLLLNYYYDQGQYSDSIMLSLEALEVFPEDADLLSWVGACYSMLGEYEEAATYTEKALAIEPYNEDHLAIMGNILYSQTKFLEAVPYYEKAIEVGIDFEVNVVNLMDAYLAAGRFQKVIDLGESVIEELPYSADIPMYIGFSYQGKNDYKNAMVYYSKAQELGDDLGLDYYFAECYYYLGDYEQAMSYIQLYLELYPEDSDAHYLKDSITLQESGSYAIIESIFQDYYLYINKVDFVEKIGMPRDLTIKETGELFNKLVWEEDAYTFYIHSDIYDFFTNDEMDSVQFSTVDDSTILANISLFNEDTDHLFIEYLDAIESPEEKTLIINVMNNGGGVTDSAVNILDSLLPGVNVCSIIDRYGNSYPNNSDESYVPFKEIYVLINKESASASELLALSLSTYLDNVTLIGERSHGKGVGQMFIEEPQNKAGYLIVNHYWNVREHNIQGKGIEPDIKVGNPDLDACLKALQNN